jgi:protein involved in polysaccharide export with SLBB domain
MQTAEDAVSRGRNFARRSLPALVLGTLFLCGCASSHKRIDNAMQTPRAPQSAASFEPYTLGCPDVLEVGVIGQTDAPNRCTVGVDGCIDLGTLGRVRVEGQTSGQAVESIAAAAGLAPNRVRLRMLEYKSRQIYLSGEVAGKHRTVPYQGPETVADLLQRAGGVTPGAETGDVHVIRSHITDGQAPEDFRVDLRAIYVDHDERTNLLLQPFDQVYVGETRKSSLTKCFPRWLRPTYERLLGLKRNEP